MRIYAQLRSHSLTTCDSRAGVQSQSALTSDFPWPQCVARIARPADHLKPNRRDGMLGPRSILSHVIVANDRDGFSRQQSSDLIVSCDLELGIRHLRV